MSTRVKVTLPNKSEMLRRLKEARDNSYYEEYFYPKLLKHAGEEKYIEGVVLMLQLAIHDYCDRLESPSADSATIQMSMDVPDFIDALVDDSKVAQQVKEMM